MRNSEVTKTACAVVAATLVVGWIGVNCASGGLQRCQSDEECPDGEQCIDESCMVPDGGTTGGATDGGSGGSGGSSGGTAGPDGGDGSTSEDTDGGSGTGTTTGDADGGGQPCGGKCEAGEKCEDGQCVANDCGGQCSFDEKCENGQCVSGCGGSCGSGELCADVGDGFECYPTCNEANSTNGCSNNGTRCIDLFRGDDSREELICDQSDCATDADCPIGTCINYVNEYGACVANGNKAPGESCSSQECENGAVCLGSPGTCRTVCDPWAASCPSGTRCSLLRATSNGYSFISLRQGWCNPSTTSNGSSNLDRCSPVDAMCNDATRCLDGQRARCGKWCRPGTTDCDNTIPPSIDASGICDNYVFGGLRAVGRCVPNCEGGYNCPDGYRCRSGLCRRECTKDSDCCSSSPCQFTCNNNNLCE